MEKHPMTRPEVVLPCLLLVWFVTAAAYAVVFTY